MKKKLSVLSMVLLFTFVLSLSSSVFAREGETKEGETSTRNSENLITRLKEKATERYTEVQSDWLDDASKEIQRNKRFLEIVGLYAPEMYDTFLDSFESHKAVHIDLFNTRKEISYQYTMNTLGELSLLKDQLLTQVDNGEITKEEARVEVKNFLKVKRETYKEMRADFRDLIQPAIDSWKTSAEEVKSLRSELKVSIENEDASRAASIIHELYPYSIEHIEFDQYKLDTMKAYFNQYLQ